MNALFSHRYLLRGNFFYLIGVCLCLYFSYHCIAGNRSLLRLISLESSIETMSLDVVKLSEKKESLKQKVVAMRPGSIDSDLLEERVRVVLGYQFGNEITILNH